jgi:hypothetical protein
MVYFKVTKRKKENLIFLDYVNLVLVIKINGFILYCVQLAVYLSPYI